MASDDSKLNKEAQSTKSTKPFSQKRRRPRDQQNKNKKTSWVWDHYTTYTKDLMKANEDGENVQIGKTTRVVCKYCKSDLDGNSNKNGTSTLQKHLELHCDGYPGSHRNVGTGQKHLAFNVEGKEVAVTHWSQENCLNATVEMIVIDEMPFSEIEKPGFKRFCAVAIPKWHIPCRKVVVKSFLSMYNAKKEDLKAELRKHWV